MVDVFLTLTAESNQRDVQPSSPKSSVDGIEEPTVNEIDVPKSSGDGIEEPPVNERDGD